MLKRFVLFPRFRGLVLCERVYHTPKDPKKPSKDNLKEKGKAEENRYFVKEYADQVKNLREYLERIQKSQEMLQVELDETVRLLKQLEAEDDAIDEEEEEEARRKAKIEKDKQLK